MSERATEIERTLREKLDAVHVELIDDSAAHADHLGAQGGGGHFRVLIVSPAFEGLSRVGAQRLVYNALGALMTTHIHALQLKTLSPSAWEDLRPRA